MPILCQVLLHNVYYFLQCSELRLREVGASRTGGQTFPIRSQISTILGLKDTIPQLCLCGVKVGHTQPIKVDEAVFQ